MKQIFICLMGALGATLWIGCGSSGTSGAGGAEATTSSTSTSGGLTTATSTGATSSATGSTGTGAGAGAGDCATDADCGGTTCVAVTPGGFKTCSRPPMEVSKCEAGQGGCCASADCTGGAKCYAPFAYCGGILGPVNQCLSNQCQTDNDCAVAGGVCLQAGLLGYPINACATAHCHQDSDCAASPGGHCAPVRTPCCTTKVELYCVYPNGGCRTDDDCSGATPNCVVDDATQLPKCAAQPVACPT